MVISISAFVGVCIVKWMRCHFNSIIALKQKFIRTKSRQVNVFYWCSNLYTIGWS